MAELVLLIISTVIGAGFTTGAELVAFFGDTNAPPVLVAVLYGVFSFAIFAVLTICARKPTPITKGIFTAFYFIFFIVMTAGLITLNGKFTAVIALLFCIAVVMFGYGKMLTINKYLMLFVLGILLIACVTNLNPSVTPTNADHFLVARDLPVAIWRAMLYAGLNCCLLEVVIMKMLKTHTRKTVLWAGAGAIFTICVFVVLILTAIKNNAVTADMPIIELSNNIITRFAVFFAILTTMMICLYNITNFAFRTPQKPEPCTAKPRNTGRGQFRTACAVSIVAFFTGLLGFKTILSAVYPFIGGFMICYVGLLCLNFFFSTRRRKCLVIDNAVNGL